MTLQNKLIAALVAVGIYLGSLVGMYFYLKRDADKVAQHSALTSYQQGVETNAKIDKQVGGMDVPALDTGLSHWLRPGN